MRIRRPRLADEFGNLQFTAGELLFSCAASVISFCVGYWFGQKRHGYKKNGMTVDEFINDKEIVEIVNVDDDDVDNSDTDEETPN